ncbi:MAG: LUD domain-containing protein [Verrucomicrobiota bacterium]|nr:LUD domain-containing protein [Verrucomicrobiota bacterium]
MMSDPREKILSRVRRALEPLEKRAAYPDYEDHIVTMPGLTADAQPWDAFKQRLQLAGGLAFDNAAELAAWLRTQKHLRGYCDPDLWLRLEPAFDHNFHIKQRFDRTRIDEYAFGITRAAGAIIETGSLILNDASTSSRLGALAPWVHVAVVSRSHIYADVVSAIIRLGDDPNVIWCTGPSRTADIEGILIKGVHGPGVQIALLDKET